MLSALFVVHTRLSARLLYANTPNKLRCKPLWSAGDEAGLTFNGPASWGEGRAAKVLLLRYVHSASDPAVYNAHILIVRYGGVVVKFKPLLDRWKKDAAPLRTAKEYPIRLDLDDASRLHALAALFPGQPIEAIIADLLRAGLDEIAAAMPYERGPKVISRDDQGDPVYEDIGLTPRFVELTRKFKKSLVAETKK
jgi:hypothetical protein